MKGFTHLADLRGNWGHLIQDASRYPGWDRLEQMSGDLTYPMSWPTFYVLLDRVWDQTVGSYELSQPDFERRLQAFYQHPIWLLNGIITDTEPVAVEHRLTAVRLGLAYQPRKVIDVGGGYGTLIRLMAETCPDIERIELLEPYSSFLHPDLKKFPNVTVVREPQPPYDLVLCTEVLEHLPDPIMELSRLNQLLRPGGGLVATWSFIGEIRCHLRENHYLQPIFQTVVRSAGFGLRGFERVPAPVWSFQKANDVSPKHMKNVRTFFVMTRPLWLVWNSVLNLWGRLKTEMARSLHR